MLDGAVQLTSSPVLLAVSRDLLCIYIMAAVNGSGAVVEKGRSGPKGRYEGTDDVIRSGVGATTA